jgi:hypothetical protein
MTAAITGLWCLEVFQTKRQRGRFLLGVAALGLGAAIGSNQWVADRADRRAAAAQARMQTALTGPDPAQIQFGAFSGQLRLPFDSYTAAVDPNTHAIRVAARSGYAWAFRCVRGQRETDGRVTTAVVKKECAG